MDSEAEILSSTAPEPNSGPWLVFLHGDTEKTQTLYSLSEEFRCYHRSIPMIQRNIICVTRQGWLLTINIQDRHCSLWNPCTLAEIDLPFPPKGLLARSNSQCILSTSPTDPCCIVVYVNYARRRIFYCHPASKNWTTYEVELERDFGDATFFNGMFYMVTYPGLAVVDFAPCSPRISFVVEEDEEEDSVHRFNSRTDILESCGVMFIVSTYFYRSIDRPVDILVRKMDFSKKQWVTVDSIGSDRVFLLGVGDPFESKTSWSASALGVKGDCIYYIAADKSVYIFDLEKETISSCTTCSADVENTVSLPFWLVPSV